MAQDPRAVTDPETPLQKAERLWEAYGYANATDYAAYARDRARWAREHPPKEAEP